MRPHPSHNDRSRFSAPSTACDIWDWFDTSKFKPIPIPIFKYYEDSGVFHIEICGVQIHLRGCGSRWVTRARHQKGIFWYGNSSFDTAMLFAILKLAGPITFIPGFAQTFIPDFVTMHFPTSPQSSRDQCARHHTTKTASFHTAMLFAFLKFTGLPFELLSPIFSRRLRWRLRRRPCIHSSS